MINEESSYDTLVKWILELPDVTQAPHRFGGIELQVGGIQFMHFHGHRQLDIRLSKEDQARTLQAGEAEEHRFAPQAGWVVFLMRQPADVEKAKKLVMLAYDNAKNKLSAVQARRGNLR